mgnify:CR=1 FL=1
MSRSDNKSHIRIGVIGKGFVGTAVSHGFSHQTGYGADIKIYDKNPVKSQNSLEETVNDSDYLFLSVPTPMHKDTGECDLSYIELVFEKVLELNDNL